MLVALGANVRIQGPKGERTIPLGEFFTLPNQGTIVRENVLANDELVLEVVVPPAPAGLRSTYLKFKERETMDFAMSAVAATGVPGPGGTLKDVRIVLGGVAPIPWRVPKAEAFVAGKPLSPEVLAEAGRLALEGAEPLEHNAYKVPLTQTLVRRALAQLAAPA
jgi:xanthine dehydrogenase YagS FAD-binding subunit